MKIIRVDLAMQTMTCSLCTVVHEIPRKLLRDQHELLVMQDDVEHDHRECKASPDNLKLAIAQRTSRKRQERAWRKLEELIRPARRCNGRPNR